MVTGRLHRGVDRVLTTRESTPRLLSDIVGVDEDPSLRLAGISVRDNTVRIRLLGADGVQVRQFFAEEALSVITELVGWSQNRRALE